MSKLKRPDAIQKMMTEASSHLPDATTAFYTLVSANPSARPALAEKLAAIEQEADERQVKLLRKVATTFITPYDREDIFTLSRAIDDVLDYAYSTVSEMRLFDVRATPHMQRMSSLLRDAGGELMLAVLRLQQHGKVANEHMRRAKKLENKIEAEYRLALAAMFKDVTEVKQVVEVMKMREVYRHLSNAADRVDEAANVIAHIVVKSM